jgi:hypothetical protein
MKDLVYQDKLQTQDEFLRCIMRGAALIRKNHGRIRKAAHSVLKRALSFFSSLFNDAFSASQTI